MQLAVISMFTVTYHVFLAALIQSPVTLIPFRNTTHRSSDHLTVKTAIKLVHFTTNFQNARCNLPTLSYRLTTAEEFLHIKAHFADNFVYLRVIYY
jgi:hypothetical protein